MVYYFAQIDEQRKAKRIVNANNSSLEECQQKYGGEWIKTYVGDNLTSNEYPDNSKNYVLENDEWIEDN